MHIHPLRFSLIQEYIILDEYHLIEYNNFHGNYLMFYFYVSVLLQMIVNLLKQRNIVVLNVKFYLVL